MEAYKTPSADLRTEDLRKHKPIKGLLIGLCLTIILATLASTINTIIFGILLGANLSGNDLGTALASNIAFLLTDLIISAAIVFYAGRSTGKRTPGKEIKFGTILASITFLIYLPIFIYSNAFTTYPAWHNILSLFLIFTLIPYGAKSVANT